MREHKNNTKIVFCTFVALFMVGFASADTYKSQFRNFASYHKTYTSYVASGYHKYIVDGVTRHTWAELYDNGIYIKPSQESSWPSYTDPTFSRTISSGREILIVVYNADNLDQWEKHRFVVDSTGPNTPARPDLDASDDSGYSNTDNITNKTSYLTFRWSGGTDTQSGFDHYEYRLDSASWSSNWKKTSKRGPVKT